jgi:hypothetical protein
MTKKWQCFGKNAIFATCKIVMLFVVVVQFSPKYGKISKLD